MVPGGTTFHLDFCSQLSSRATPPRANPSACSGIAVAVTRFPFSPLPAGGLARSCSRCPVFPRSGAPRRLRGCAGTGLRKHGSRRGARASEDARRGFGPLSRLWDRAPPHPPATPRRPPGTKPAGYYACVTSRRWACCHGSVMPRRGRKRRTATSASSGAALPDWEKGGGPWRGRLKALSGFSVVGVYLMRVWSPRRGVGSSPRRAGFGGGLQGGEAAESLLESGIVCSKTWSQGRSVAGLRNPEKRVVWPDHSVGREVRDEAGGNTA